MRKWSRLRGGLVFVVCLWLPALCAVAEPQGEAAVTLSGRGTEAQIRESDGTVTRVDTKKLTIVNKSSRPAAEVAPVTRGSETASGEKEAEQADSGQPAAKEEKAAGPEQGKKAGTKTPEKELKKKAPESKTPASKEESPEVKAAKEAAAEQIRALRQTGAAYFFTPDGQPISASDLEERLRTGRVSDIRATTQYQQTWSPEIPQAPEEKPKTP